MNVGLGSVDSVKAFFDAMALIIGIPIVIMIFAAIQAKMDSRLGDRVEDTIARKRSARNVRNQSSTMMTNDELLIPSSRLPDVVHQIDAEDSVREADPDA